MIDAEVLDLLPPEEAALVARAAAVLEARLRYRAGEAVPVTSPKAAAELLRMRLAGRARETFAVLWLDAKEQTLPSRMRIDIQALNLSDPVSLRLKA